MDSLQEIPLIAWSLLVCWLVCLPLFGLLVQHRRKFSGPSRVKACINVQACEVNQSIFELDRPKGNPKMQVLFFHGLQLEDYTHAHVSTWESGEGSCIWPQEWLVKDFPGAHVLYVAYDGRVGEKFRESVIDMDIIAENLISDLMHAKVGQFPNCPVILVGHSVGGLVIKRMCCEAHKLLNMKGEGLEREKFSNFLNSLKGIFFYGTPHRGSPVAEKVIEEYGGPLLDYFKLFSKHTTRLNDTFDQICRKYNWRIEGVGESNPTKWGLLGESFIAPEGSARQGSFNIVDGTDHFTISKPMTTKTRSFYKLGELLSNIAKNVEEERQQQGFGNFQHLPHNLVGTDSVMENIKAKLRDFRTLGLVGMGGIGKSTLAKAIFNELCPHFEYSCFVADVKLKQGTRDAIQEEVLNLMTYKGKKAGDKLALSALNGRRLLLVLDDTSSSIRDGDEDVLSIMRDVTAPESRFIVTSREEDLVKSLGEAYRVPFLNKDAALKLFKSLAFPGEEIPPETLQSHMETIVEKCEGLPLTLKVLGKYLKDKKDEKYWRGTLQALVKAEHVSNFTNRLWAKLRPSYDGLGIQEQQIFLDAATFFNVKYRRDWTLADAKAVWTAAYGTSVALWWQTLVDFCLVYDVKEYQWIKVHEQLQSLGVKIAKETSNDGNCRVWDAELGLQMLQSTKKMNGKTFHAFRAGHLRLDSDRGRADIHIPSTALSNLKQLHFFEAESRIIIDGAKEQGSVPSELVLLVCVGQNLFNPALQNRLAILRISELEYLPDTIEQLSYLEQLTITDSPRLRFLPQSFGRLSSLSHLEFQSCENLHTLPDSFGGLSSLSHLKFQSCKSLCTLPDSFGGLSSLSNLKFQSCENLRTLPDSFGGLSVLCHLKFWMCENLHTLPDSFGGLSSLSHLYFDWCQNLRTLPDSFGGLSSLSHLYFDWCQNFRTLPDSFGGLSSLSHLKFQSCKNLCTLPDAFGGLSSLSNLTFQSCENLRTLPDSFGGLSSLSHLKFWMCENLRTLPDSFGGLCSLSHLDFDWCQNLLILPDSLGGLSSLSHLKFRSCQNLHTLPDSFGGLSSLSHLKFQSCKNLCTLPDSFGGLCSLSNLKFQSCENLHTLPDSFGGLSSLSHLKFWMCENLRTLPDSFGGLSSLSHLYFDWCENLRTLPDSFGGMASLSHLEFWSCGNLRTLPDSFGGLSSLRHLVFQSCENLRTLPDSFGGLSSLSYLNFDWCQNLRTLPDSFGALSSLSHLEFRWCENLRTLPYSFGGLACLKHLRLNAEKMPNSFGDLKNLRYLEIWLKSAASIQDSIKSLPSLQTLKLVFDGVGDTAYSLLPSWLKGPNTPAAIGKNSKIEFQVQDGYFSVKDSKSYADRTGLVWGL